MSTKNDEEPPPTSLSSDDEKEEDLPEDDGFSAFAPVGEAPMTRALSGYDPTLARTMTAQQAKDGRPRGKQWWKDIFPTFVEVSSVYAVLYVLCCVKFVVV